MKKEFKWSLFVPLIGPYFHAATSVLGSDPNFILSYEAFFGNDNQLLTYLKQKDKDIPYNAIDAEDYDESKQDFNDMDFVFAVPPCAGLSMLNKKANAEHAANDWIYKTAEYTLDKIKPKYLIGENAPGLYSTMGIGVVDKLNVIAKKHDYKLMLIKVNTVMHGIPQRRIRTFYYFIKGNIPKVNHITRHTESYETYMRNFEQTDSQERLDEAIHAIQCRPEYQFLLSVYGKDFREKMQHSSAFASMQNDENISFVKYRKFLEDNNIDGKWDRGIRNIDHMENKLNQRKGFWDAGFMSFKGIINAVVGRNVPQTIHPHCDRNFTNSELLHLYGYPSDFSIIDYDRDKGKIPQNVPICTAKDSINFILNANDFYDDSVKFVKYNNVKNNIDEIEADKQSVFDL